MARKAAAGTGTIRKKTITRNGKSYEYWEARYTQGYDPGTGKQIQRSITGKTQKEVAQKLKAATAAIDAGTYTVPSRMAVGQWLDIWTSEYLGAVKPRTIDLYKGVVKSRIKPGLGAVKSLLTPCKASTTPSASPRTAQQDYHPKSTEYSTKPCSRQYPTDISKTTRQIPVSCPGRSAKN